MSKQPRDGATSRSLLFPPEREPGAMSCHLATVRGDPPVANRATCGPKPPVGPSVRPPPASVGARRTPPPPIPPMSRAWLRAVSLPSASVQGPSAARGQRGGRVFGDPDSCAHAFLSPPNLIRLGGKGDLPEDTATVSPTVALAPRLYTRPAASHSTPLTASASPPLPPGPQSPSSNYLNSGGGCFS